MSELGFLHTHFIPKDLMNNNSRIYAIVVPEFYPDLNNIYYDEPVFFNNIEKCIDWTNNFYNSNNIKYSIENISVLKYKDIEKIKILKNKGIISYQLYHHSNNIYFNENSGLTSEGKLLLDEIKKENIYLDLSHLSDDQIFNVLNYYNGKILISHCVCRELLEVYDYRSNSLSIETFKILSNYDCIFGIPFLNDLVCKVLHDKNETDDIIINNIALQIEFISKSVGSDRVCLGADFADYSYYSKIYKQDLHIPSVMYDFRGYNILYKILKDKKLTNKDIDNIFFLNIKNILLDFK